MSSGRQITEHTDRPYHDPRPQLSSVETGIPRPSAPCLHRTDWEHVILVTLGVPTQCATNSGPTFPVPSEDPLPREPFPDLPHIRHEFSVTSFSLWLRVVPLNSNLFCPAFHLQHPPLTGTVRPPTDWEHKGLGRERWGVGAGAKTEGSLTTNVDLHGYWLDRRRPPPRGRPLPLLPDPLLAPDQ